MILGRFLANQLIRLANEMIESAFPQGLKPTVLLLLRMYGLKPVPFN
jgi:hypothetical protein